MQMSEATYKQVRDRCTVIDKGYIQLRGQNREIAVYALGSRKKGDRER